MHANQGDRMAGLVKTRPLSHNETCQHHQALVICMHLGGTHIPTLKLSQLQMGVAPYDQRVGATWVSLMINPILYRSHGFYTNPNETNRWIERKKIRCTLKPLNLRDMDQGG
eukprot:TRINITY_DN24099_c0_g1_i1.p1 TRINITY_DN24099_c0_g1~~TRINITY_DN24099_c0_g1_i1.p1  ORF type:complete len:112 (+),score=10.61 TRINITY_DN24099_c0_g1_i1:1160-1495(+)